MQSLIGIPYRFNGREMTGADCLGLVQMYLASQDIHESFSDGNPIEPKWYEIHQYRLVKYLCRHYKRIKNPEAIRKNDIVLFEINGEGHLGVAIDDYKRILSTFPGNHSFIIRLTTGKSFFISGFRNRKDGD